MGRRITVGISPTSLGSFNIVDNVLTSVVNNDNIILDPSGNGTVTLPSNYLTRSGIGANSILPKNYVDNNISPGALFISFD
jgi:hypothetical protein